MFDETDFIDLQVQHGNFKQPDLFYFQNSQTLLIVGPFCVKSIILWKKVSQ